MTTKADQLRWVREELGVGNNMATDLMTIHRFLHRWIEENDPRWLESAKGWNEDFRVEEQFPEAVRVLFESHTPELIDHTFE
jgi:hypothetical protein